MNHICYLQRSTPDKDSKTEVNGTKMLVHTIFEDWVMYMDQTCKTDSTYKGLYLLKFSKSGSEVTVPRSSELIWYEMFVHTIFIKILRSG